MGGGRERRGPVCVCVSNSDSHLHTTPCVTAGYTECVCDLPHDPPDSQHEAAPLMMPIRP